MNVGNSFLLNSLKDYRLNPQVLINTAMNQEILIFLKLQLQKEELMTTSVKDQEVV
jgi:hypothetical protein